MLASNLGPNFGSLRGGASDSVHATFSFALCAFRRSEMALHNGLCHSVSAKRAFWTLSEPQNVGTLLVNKIVRFCERDCWHHALNKLFDDFVEANRVIPCTPHSRPQCVHFVEAKWCFTMECAISPRRNAQFRHFTHPKM